MSLQSHAIRQVDLAIDTDEFEALRSVMANRWLTEGPHTARLTEMLTAATGSHFVTFAPNGTLGLFLALLALDLPRGGEILIPSFTFYGSASAAVFAGLKPVFVDCDPDTFNIDLDDARRRVTSETVAIMPVHIYGQSCDIDGTMRLAREYGLKVVEDAAQAFGVTFRGRHAGTFGDIGVISFYSDKVVTMGEGAALLTQSDDLYQKLRLIRNQGRPNSGTFVHPALGMNFRITDMQAAVGCIQLGKFAGIARRRVALFERYKERLAGIGDVRLMAIHPDSNLVPFRAPIRSRHKERIETTLKAEGIETRSFFYPMHLQPKLKNECTTGLAVSEQISRDGLCLPVHAHITEADVDRICACIASCFAKQTLTLEPA